MNPFVMRSSAVPCAILSETGTRADCPQALGISHKTLYDSKDALPTDLNEWLHHYKQERMRQGKIRWRRTPFETMIDGKEIWREKFGT